MTQKTDWVTVQFTRNKQAVCQFQNSKRKLNNQETIHTLMIIVPVKKRLVKT